MKAITPASSTRTSPRRAWTSWWRTPAAAGRLDMAVRFNLHIYLFEFKVVELAPEGAAMTQLRERRYADKYRDTGQPIYLIAVEFSRESRNLAAFEAAPELA